MLTLPSSLDCFPKFLRFHIYLLFSSFLLSCYLTSDLSCPVLSCPVMSTSVSSTKSEGKFKKVIGGKNKRKNLAVAVAGRSGVLVGPRVELRMRSRGGKDSVVTSLVWHHKVSLLTLTIK